MTASQYLEKAFHHRTLAAAGSREHRMCHDSLFKSYLNLARMAELIEESQYLVLMSALADIDTRLSLSGSSFPMGSRTSDLSKGFVGF